MGTHCHTTQSIEDDSLIYGKLRITGGHILAQSGKHENIRKTKRIGFQIRTRSGVGPTLIINWNMCYKDKHEINEVNRGHWGSHICQIFFWKNPEQTIDA